MDTTQLLLTIILSLTTLLLVVVGIQLIFVLREVRRTLMNVNRIVNGFDSFGSGLDHGLQEVVGFLNGFKTIMKIVESLPINKHDKNK